MKFYMVMRRLALIKEPPKLERYFTRKRDAQRFIKKRDGLNIFKRTLRQTTSIDVLKRIIANNYAPQLSIRRLKPPEGK